MPLNGLKRLSRTVDCLSITTPRSEGFGRPPLDGIKVIPALKPALFSVENMWIQILCLRALAAKQTPDICQQVSGRWRGCLAPCVAPHLLTVSWGVPASDHRDAKSRGWQHAAQAWGWAQQGQESAAFLQRRCAVEDKEPRSKYSRQLLRSHSVVSDSVWPYEL